MHEVYLAKDNLMSVVFGKDVWLPWRGQSCLSLYIPYSEWLLFRNEYKHILKDRQLPDYVSLNSGTSPEELQFRDYMFDVGWALYNEVMLSANKYKDATLILPMFEGVSESLTVIECANIASYFDEGEFNKYYNNFVNMIPNSTYVEWVDMSEWNQNLLYLSIYLQSFAYGDIKKINVRRVTENGFDA